MSSYKISLAILLFFKLPELYVSVLKVTMDKALKNKSKDILNTFITEIIVQLVKEMLCFDDDP